MSEPPAVPYHLGGLDFERNQAKDRANQDKHGLGFAAAVTVFLDPDHVVERPTKPEFGEPRFKVVGRVRPNIAAVIFTHPGDVRRLISARRAGRDERRSYHQGAATT